MIRLKGELRVNPNLACLFCKRTTDDEHVYGKIYTLKDITCHYFCVLLSSCAVQRGDDNDGILGFLYKDIVGEYHRSQKHKCSYCGEMGATLGCCISQCRKQFHLPCGREHDAISIFRGTYKSYCEKHIPKQNMPSDVVEVSRARRTKYNNEIRKYKKASRCDIEEKMAQEDGCVCVICYSPVLGFPGPTNFWPPCCARDVWFHRLCLQRMALSAGVHYLKCPLCNDKKQFYEASVNRGIYVPDRDAAWELEQNAFAEIYERPEQCSAEICKCSMGRDHDADNGPWELKLCLLCGSSGMHTGCLEESTNRYICELCGKVPLDNVEEFEKNLQKVQLPTNNSASARSGPIMTSRMSIRRTKPSYRPASSRPARRVERVPSEDKLTNTERSRLELNLTTPKLRTSYKQTTTDILINNKIYSPMKLLDEKMRMQVTDLDDNYTMLLVDRLREKFSKPRPMSAKRRILNDIIKEILSESMSKQISMMSPRKSVDVAVLQQKSPNAKTTDSSIQVHDECTPSKKTTESQVETKSACTIKFSPLDKKIDMETFMNRYLSEVDRKNNEALANESVNNDAKAVEANAKATEANAKATEANAKSTEANAKATEANAKATEANAKAIEYINDVIDAKKELPSEPHVTEILTVKKRVRFLEPSDSIQKRSPSNLKKLKPILKRKAPDDSDSDIKKIKIENEKNINEEFEIKEEKAFIKKEEDGKLKYKRHGKKSRKSDFRNISNINNNIKKEHSKENDIYYNSNKTNDRKRDKYKKKSRKIKATVKFNITESKNLRKKGYKRSKSNQIAIKIQFKKRSDMVKFKSTLVDTKPVTLKQTVLNFSPESKAKGVPIVQPEIKKHKHKKKIISNDNMKQMSLDAFFQHNKS